ncbi:MAG: hypothetical protein ACRDWI_11765 [Jiangellaceae bacterium]
MKVVVAREVGPYERLVAIVPELVGRPTDAARTLSSRPEPVPGALHDEAAYEDSGATVSTTYALASADVVLSVEGATEGIRNPKPSDPKTACH